MEKATAASSSVNGIVSNIQIHTATVGLSTLKLTPHNYTYWCSFLSKKVQIYESEDTLTEDPQKSVLRRLDGIAKTLIMDLSFPIQGPRSAHILKSQRDD